MSEARETAGIEPATASPAAVDLAGIDLGAMEQNARLAARFLKAFAHEQRLMILCHLAHGECAVGELEGRLGMRQAHLSQQLARLRQDGLVRTRRDSRTIFYRLGSADAEAMIALLYSRFCQQDGVAAPCAPPPATRAAARGDDR